jgi:hypothetical protein
LLVLSQRIFFSINARYFVGSVDEKRLPRIAIQSHPAFPVTIYYAFKQSEAKSDAGTASTGWETFLAAVMRAGFTIAGTDYVTIDGIDVQALDNSLEFGYSLVNDNSA